MDQSPAAFARKLSRLPGVVSTQQPRALEARARVTKTYILAAAARRTRQARSSWVQYRIAGDVAAVRVRGGMAHLTELGSYKKPDGWDERPKTLSARRVTLARRRGLTLNESSALSTPEGPRASVHHPHLRERPFFKEGVAASRVPGQKAYKKIAVDDAIKTVFR